MIPSSALLILRILSIAEPVLSVAALVAFLRVRRQIDMPSMRDYLAVRTGWGLLCIGVLLHMTTHLMVDAYFYLFWAGFFVLAGLLLRVALAALDRHLWAFRGLQALRRIGLLWFLFVASLLTLPMVAALVGAILHHHAVDGDWWSLHLAGAVAVTEFLAVVSVLIVGLRAGLSPRSRIFGILAGFALESGTLFLSSQLGSPELWSWHNLISEAATDSALILWIVYLLLPDRQGPMKEPSAQVLRWTQVAQWTFRDQLPAEGEEAGAEEEKKRSTMPH